MVFRLSFAAALLLPFAIACSSNESDDGGTTGDDQNVTSTKPEDKDDKNDKGADDNGDKAADDKAGVSKDFAPVTLALDPRSRETRPPPVTATRPQSIVLELQKIDGWSWKVKSIARPLENFEEDKKAGPDLQRLTWSTTSPFVESGKIVFEATNAKVKPAATKTFEVTFDIK